MLPFERIPLGEWLPDQPSYRNPGALEAKNCIPQIGSSYRSFNSFEAVTDATPGSEPILDAIWTDVTGQIEIIAGTATTLLRLVGNGWTTVGTGYSVTGWDFVGFGNTVIALADGVDPQVIDLTVGGPSFSALTGTPESPPRARRGAVVRDFVMFGDLETDGRLIQWSGYNNSGIWDSTGNTLYQADGQLLFEGGKVQRLVGGPFGYIFQERNIRAIEYVGPPYVFNIQLIDRGRGTPAGNSVVSAGDQVFFYAQDGFFALRGREFRPIGEERVNRWFLANCDPDEIPNIRGAIDRPNRLVLWSFKTSSSLTDFDRTLFYNYSTNRWAYAESDFNNVFEVRSPGYNLDTLATILTAGVTIDSFPIDSDAYAGGNVNVFAANSEGAIGSLDGPALQAEIDTREFDAPANRRRRIANIRPIVEGPSASTRVLVGKRNSLVEPVVWSSPRSLNDVGEAPILSDARYHRIRLRIDGGFTHAHLVDVMSRPSGRF